MAGMTFGSMAQISTQRSMAIGQSQASSLGLEESDGNTLALTNLLDKDDDSNLVGKLMSGSVKNKSRNKIGGGIQSQQDMFQMNKDILGGLFSIKV